MKKKKQMTYEDVRNEIERLETKMKDKTHDSQQSGGDTKTLTRLSELYRLSAAFLATRAI